MSLPAIVIAAVIILPQPWQAGIVQAEQDGPVKPPAAPSVPEASPDPGLTFHSEESRAEIGARHVALELEGIDGTLVNARRLAGRPFVVDFFATWCQPCHRALADIIAARGASHSATIPIVLVDVGEAPEVVRRWVAAARLPDDVIVTIDPTGQAARRWGARRLPTTFIVDAAGIVRHINRGWGGGYRNRMGRWLRGVTAVPDRPVPP